MTPTLVTNGATVHSIRAQSVHGATGPSAVSMCETQPVMAEGLRTLIAGCPDLRFGRCTDSLSGALDLVRAAAPDVLIVDKAFGIQAILDWLSASDRSMHLRGRV